MDHHFDDDEAAFWSEPASRRRHPTGRAATSPSGHVEWSTERLGERTRAHHVIDVAPIAGRSMPSSLVGRLCVVAAASVVVIPLASAFSGSDPSPGKLADAADAAAVVAAEPGAAPATTAAEVATSPTPAATAVAGSAADATPATAAATAAASAPDAAPSSTAAVAATPAAAPQPQEVVEQTAPPTAAAAAAAGQTTTASVPAVRVEPVCALTYVVAAGDYWIRIAEGAGIPLAQLLEHNLATVDTPLYPGREVCLPAGATMPSPPPPPPTVPPSTAAPTAPPTTAAPTTTVRPPSSYSEQEVIAIIRFVWPDDLEDKAIAIADRESNLNPAAQNWCCSGLFQIYFNVHKGWLAGIGVTSPAQLLDPATNARAAYALYQRSGGWGPWGG
jgi:LysM repeat protein